MRLEEIVTIVRNRLTTLANTRAQAVAMGDLAVVVALDSQMEETRRTLETLESKG